MTPDQLREWADAIDGEKPWAPKAADVIDQLRAHAAALEELAKAEGEGQVLQAFYNSAMDRAERAEAALAESERKCERLRAQMKQMEKDSREDLRSAAAEASWAERFPDEPYGTY